MQHLDMLSAWFQHEQLLPLSLLTTAVLVLVKATSVANQTLALRPTPKITRCSLNLWRASGQAAGSAFSAPPLPRPFRRPPSPPPPPLRPAPPLQRPPHRLSPPLHTPSTPLLHPSSRILMGIYLYIQIHTAYFTTVTCTSFGTWSRRDNACFDLWSLREAC